MTIIIDIYTILRVISLILGFVNLFAIFGLISVYWKKYRETKNEFLKTGIYFFIYNAFLICGGLFEVFSRLIFISPFIIISPILIFVYSFGIFIFFRIIHRNNTTLYGM